MEWMFRFLVGLAVVLLVLVPVGIYHSVQENIKFQDKCESSGGIVIDERYHDLCISSDGRILFSG